MNVKELMNRVEKVERTTQELKRLTLKLEAVTYGRQKEKEDYKSLIQELDNKRQELEKEARKLREELTEFLQSEK